MFSDATWRLGEFKQDETTKSLAVVMFEEAKQNYYIDSSWRQIATNVLPMPVKKLNLTDGDLPAADVVMAELEKKIERSAPAGNSVKRYRVDQNLLNNPIKYGSFIGSLVK